LLLLVSHLLDGGDGLVLDGADRLGSVSLLGLVRGGKTHVRWGGSVKLADCLRGVVGEGWWGFNWGLYLLYLGIFLGNLGFFGVQFLVS
jgi:hypothetical protein